MLERHRANDCLPCEQRAQCLRTPEKTRVRQIAFFCGKAGTAEESHTDLMKCAIDSEEGRARYGRRFATVEPVFGNIRHNKRLDRFTLRGRKKVDTQSKLYCLVVITAQKQDCRDRLVQQHEKAKWHRSNLLHFCRKPG